MSPDAHDAVLPVGRRRVCGRTEHTMDMRILVVDDEPSLRGMLVEFLTQQGYSVDQAASGETALQMFRQSPYPLVLTDIRMPRGMNGIELLQNIKDIDPACQVIIVTSNVSLDTAIAALRQGAYDYLTRPFEDIELISAVVKRAGEKIRLIRENEILIQKLESNNVELERVNHLLKQLAIRDGLTGLYNHRHFQELLNDEVIRSKRHHREFSLIFLDVDLFKQYNDAHGHPQGDQLLKDIGRIIEKCVLPTDIVARYGGEEFVVLLPEAPKDRVQRVAEEIRLQVESFPFAGREAQPLEKITVSLGIATFPHNGNDGPALLHSADTALYQAKQSGRNAIREAR